MTEVRLVISPALKPLLDRSPYKVVSHGRGSGVSWAFARALLVRGLDGKQVVLCARETQTSIRDSVHALLREQIDMLGLSGAYQVLDTEIRGPGRTRFVFRGIRTNPRDVKSMEGVTVCWVAEAEAVSQESWDILIPTVMRSDEAEMWVDYNPANLDDPTHEMFAVHRQPGEWYIHVTYHDNPWFPARLREEMEHLRAVNPAKYQHIYLGEPYVMTEAKVFAPGVQNLYEPPHWLKWVGSQARADIRVSGGLDFGFQDADALGIWCWSVRADRRERWKLGGYKERRESVSMAAVRIKRVQAEVSEWLVQAGLPTDYLIYSDFGAGGKQIAWELYTVHGIQCFEAAIKQDRRLAVDLLRDEVTEGTARYQAGDASLDEMKRVVWRRNDRDQIVREIDDDAYHPDAIWADIYALRPAWSAVPMAQPVDERDANEQKLIEQTRGVYDTIVADAPDWKQAIRRETGGRW